MDYCAVETDIIGPERRSAACPRSACCNFLAGVLYKFLPGQQTMRISARQPPGRRRWDGRRRSDGLSGESFGGLPPIPRQRRCPGGSFSGAPRHPGHEGSGVTGDGAARRQGDLSRTRARRERPGGSVKAGGFGEGRRSVGAFPEESSPTFNSLEEDENGRTAASGLTARRRISPKRLLTHPGWAGHDDCHGR